MKTYRAIIVPLLAAGMLSVGCQKTGKTGEPAREQTPGVSFSAKSGLRISSETAKFIGLQTAEVEERKVASVFQFAARIFRGGSEVRFATDAPVAINTLASGWISPSQAALLPIGSAILVAGENERPFPARVLALDRSMEAAGGQTEVVLSIADKDRLLPNGAFVTATAAAGGEKTATGVPRSALLHTAEGDFVYTASGEAFVRAAVTLGGANGDFVEVTDGLYAGDQVVVSAAMSLWLAEIQALRGGKGCADGH